MSIFFSFAEDMNDDEVYWQEKVSSGFDQILDFASTELDKSRRSFEESEPSPEKIFLKQEDSMNNIGRKCGGNERDAQMSGIMKSESGDRRKSGPK